MNARLILPNFGDREADEANARGYLGSGYVQLGDGRTIPVVFYDIVRLRQDLASEAEEGRPFIADPGLIVLTEITRSNMEKAVERLAEEGFFQQLVPSSR